MPELGISESRMRISLPDSDNIFATILEKRHPKEHETFEIPEQTIIIKGNFSHLKTNEPKSSSFHKLVQSQCGDDNVQSGNGQNIIRVDPCLKLFPEGSVLLLGEKWLNLTSLIPLKRD